MIEMKHPKASEPIKVHEQHVELLESKGYKKIKQKVANKRPSSLSTTEKGEVDGNGE